MCTRGLRDVGIILPMKKEAVQKLQLVMGLMILSSSSRLRTVAWKRKVG